MNKSEIKKEIERILIECKDYSYMGNYDPTEDLEKLLANFTKNKIDTKKEYQF